MSVFSRIKTWVSAEVLTASTLNAEFDNIITNMVPSGIEDVSASVGDMQVTADPGASGTESLATTLQGEIERLRFVIKRIVGAQWYTNPNRSLQASSLAVLAGDVSAGAVVEAALGTGAVTAAKIGTDAVTTVKVQDGAITEAKIGAGAVTSAKLGAGSVTTDKIGDSNVTRVKLVAVGQQISASSGTFFGSATSYTDITNLSISISVGTRPIFITLISADVGGSNTSHVSAETSSGQIAFTDGSNNVLGHFSIGVVSTQHVPVQIVTALLADNTTHTIKARYRMPSSDTFRCEYYSLFVFEL